jgi:hypothetical protein
MLYLALLPLLAISGAMAGPFRRDRSTDWTDKSDTNRQIFLDPISGQLPVQNPRLAVAYSRKRPPSPPDTLS